MTYLALCRIELSNGQTENALPCPFCAAAADLQMQPVGDTGYRIECATCGAIGPTSDDDDMEALVAWNTRYFYQDSDDAPAALPDC